MNWKNEAIERLNRYPAMVKAMENIPLEIKRLGWEAESIPSCSADHIHTQSTAGPRDDRIINNMVKRQEPRQAFENAKAWVDTTQNAMLVLTPEEEIILHRMYIEPQRGVVTELCAELGMEQSSIYRHRDQALYRFTMALYGAS